MKYSLGVDVGGTFTDFVAVDEYHNVSVFKTLTTPADPSLGVIDGAERFADQLVAQMSDVLRIIHGTTLVANSIIERDGARTALVTTTGFGDVLEIGREARYDLYDLTLERPEPLIPRPLRFEVRERMRADGTPLEPLDKKAAEALAGRLVELKIESVAICLLHAYTNAEHERQLADIIRRDAPTVDITLSSEIAPEWREYERTSTAAANAFVLPLVRGYLTRLEAEFASLGVRASLSILMSNGGVTSAAVAARLPVQMVESGPAGGVMAAAFFGRRASIPDLISFDMGGTTAKVSLIEGGSPLHVSEFEVARVARFKKGSGLPLKISSIELIEIGTGGGSIARRDALDLLKVGPVSAGADPGPACYGRGGTRPTVTDADLYLGYLDSQYFLGGTMELRPELAEAALTHLATELNIDVAACAGGIFEIVNRQMALALRTHVLERGHDPRRFTLVAFGGAGPVHAYEVARHLGIQRILYPPAAGVASALGFLVSPFAVDLVRTYPSALTRVNWSGVAERFSDMTRQATRLLEQAGAPLEAVVFERRADMRYVGQGYEVTVPVPDGRLGPHLETPLRRSFEIAYAKRFGSLLESAQTEVLQWRLVATARQSEVDLSFGRGVDGEPIKGTRIAYFPEVSHSIACPVFDRYRLAPGSCVPGPALIEERESTIVIGPSADAEVDGLGDLLVTFRQGSGV